MPSLPGLQALSDVVTDLQAVASDAPSAFGADYKLAPKKLVNRINIQSQFIQNIGQQFFYNDQEQLGPVLKEAIDLSMKTLMSLEAIVPKGQVDFLAEVQISIEDNKTLSELVTV